ncbi:PDZ domain-containing protein [Dactylosporangium sp. NBC_01737]|uniref:PDZ domain-containing protein n=1 Tax=Dactylosporangium sp. NBC_01737 TaxID=2975959 RepID=UPI002E0D6EA1|nr:PDZ domain-containing protein [Dactylosporangium sp. NBC_01737]
MLMSTLAEPPGLVYEVKGLVFANANLNANFGGKMPKMVKSLVEQAQQLGANGIVDIRTAVGGDHGCCVMTGTAVLIANPPGPPYLGAQLLDATNGAQIGVVAAGGPAERHGLRQGDVVTHADGAVSVKSNETFDVKSSVVPRLVG